MIEISVVSIFPDLVRHWFSQGIVGRAENKRFILNYYNPRDYSNDNYRRIDDRPFGGGSGMVMQYEPLAKIADELNTYDKPFHIYVSPQGIPFNQGLAKQLAEQKRLTFWCGRYEGIDQRFIDKHIDLEISAGDFVLSGGELPATMMIDAILRLIDGVLGNQQSAEEDSFQHQLLDCPHYTRPEIIDNMPAPEILLSGNHQKIAQWRLKQALGATFLRRPDIFQSLNLSKQQMALLNEFLHEGNLNEQNH